MEKSGMDECNTIITKVITSKKYINLQALTTTLCAAWGLKYSPKTKNADVKTLDFFLKKQDADFVIEKGPWNFRGNLVLVNRWPEELAFTQLELNKTEFWIHANNIPVCFITEKMVEIIGNAGCDGSILLDDTSSFTGEKTAVPNQNSARGFDVVDNIKSAVERACPGVVSCADILAIAARDSVAILGGPQWNVKVGRRDARTASRSAANNGIPPPTSNLNALISRFSALGLSTRDMVALSGSHTIGQARCTSFRARIYNETNLDASLAQTRQGNCPRANGTGDNNLAPLDLQTSTAFDNYYYKNLVNRRGLLHSDQQLFNGGSTDSIVTTYSNNPNSFNSDFAAAMIRMGDISPLTGSNGEVRRNCRRTN